MKKISNLFLLAAVVTPLINYTIRSIQNHKMRSKIADEGLETASDVLYPNRQPSFREYRVALVLPQ